MGLGIKPGSFTRLRKQLNSDPCPTVPPSGPKGQDSEQGACDSSLSRHPVGGKQLALWCEGTAVVGGLRAGWAAEATHLSRLGSVLSGSLKSGLRNFLSTCPI